MRGILFIKHLDYLNGLNVVETDISHSKSPVVVFQNYAGQVRLHISYAGQASFHISSNVILPYESWHARAKSLDEVIVLKVK